MLIPYLMMHTTTTFLSRIRLYTFWEKKKQNYTSTFCSRTEAETTRDSKTCFFFFFFMYMHLCNIYCFTYKPNSSTATRFMLSLDAKALPTFHCSFLNMYVQRQGVRTRLQGVIYVGVETRNTNHINVIDIGNYSTIV